jgi:hypothetical protein
MRQRDRVTARVVFGSASIYRMPLNVGRSITAQKQARGGKHAAYTGVDSWSEAKLPPEGTASAPQP